MRLGNNQGQLYYYEISKKKTNPKTPPKPKNHFHHRQISQISGSSDVIFHPSLHISKATSMKMTDKPLFSLFGGSFFIIHNEGRTKEGLGEVIVSKSQLFANLS